MKRVIPSYGDLDAAGKLVKETNDLACTLYCTIVDTSGVLIKGKKSLESQVRVLVCKRAVCKVMQAALRYPPDLYPCKLDLFPCNWMEILHFCSAKVRNAPVPEARLYWPHLAVGCVEPAEGVVMLGGGGTPFIDDRSDDIINR